MKRTRRRLLTVGLSIFALWYAWAWFQVVLSAQALQHDYDVNGAPGAHDHLQEEP